MLEDKMELADWLDDLSVRFVINLPLEELSTAARICFQIEEAQWFYEDFVRPLDPELPSLNLRHFTVVMFQRCPLLMDFTQDDQERAFQAFLEYKTMVPVRGAIMLNHRMDEVVMVKGWKKNANWSFPRGKIDQNELDLTCALREVYEETGYDLKGSGLVATEAESKSIEVQIRGQELKMYVFRGIPMDTVFVPRTRKEISKVSWHKLADLPILKSKKQQQLEGQGPNTASNAKFYMVAPFLGPLKKWISQQKKLDKLALPAQAKILSDIQGIETDNITSDQETYNEHLRGGSIDDQHLNRLLQTLRQSSQALSSDLPEVSIPKDPPSVPPGNATVVNSDSLKAVLFGAPANVPAIGGAPHEHIIRQPALPPDLGQRRPQEIPNMQAAPISTLMANPRQHTSHPNAPPMFPPAFPSFSESGPQQGFPRVQPLPPITQPVLDRAGYSVKDKILPPASQINRSDLSRGSQHAQPSHVYSPLTLNSEKSSLLSLFKSDGKSSTDGFATKTPYTSLDLGSDGNRRLESPAVFVPPRLESQSEPSIKQTTKAPTAQQTKLLHLFRKPSMVSEARELEPSLAQPAAELSAFPMGPHSRHASDVNTGAPSPGHVSKDAVLGQIKIQKRPQSQEDPVSATVTGPLNFPQFDMIRSASRGKRQHSSGDQTSAKVSPIQILSRPSSSHTQVSPSSQSSVTVTQRTAIKPELKQPRSKVAPKSEQTSLNEAKARDAVSKPFQPQILSRPKQPSNSHGPSPDVICPSPQPKTILSRDSKPSDDHKQSLLSLFTKPSTAVSPPTASQPKPAKSPDIIGPVEKPAISSDNQLDIVLKNGSTPSNPGPTANTAAQMHPHNAGKPTKKYYAPDRMPSKPLSLETAAPILANGGGKDLSGENKNPSAANQGAAMSPTSAITPANQAYLLSFLKGLK